MTGTDLRHDARQDAQEPIGGVYTPVPCPVCATPVQPRPKYLRPRMYCSARCRWRAHNEARRRAYARVRAEELARPDPRQRPLPLPPPSRFLDVPAKPTFLGPGYEPGKDQKRLKRHCQVVLDFLRRHPGEWFTYQAIGEATGVPIGSVRSRISNLKNFKPRPRYEIPWRTRSDRFREVTLVEDDR